MSGQYAEWSIYEEPLLVKVEMGDWLGMAIQYEVW